MTIKTGLELFKSLWLMEPQAALSYLQMWEQYMQSPEGQLFRSQEQEEKKAFDKSIFLQQDDVQYAPVDLWSKAAKSFTSFDGAHTVIIPVEGPLMKADYCGYAGTGTLSNFFRMADQTESVQNIILLIDSPGGTVDGTAIFAETIAASQKNVQTVIAGMCCSAAYWIGSGAKGGLYATSATDIIGSIGTMVSWYDRTKYLEENGIVLREFFATKSQDKNKAFREASKGDGKLLVQSMLDPMNNEFLGSVKANREGKLNLEQEDVLTGKTYLAKDALKYGLIDGITSLEKILEQSAPQQKQQSSFSMKTFKHVLKAAGVESVYAENKFFGLTEDQLVAVEAAMQASEDNSTAAAAENTRLTGELATAKADHKKATEDLTAANSTIKTLQDENAQLIAADGTKPAEAAKEEDKNAAAEAVPVTSVEAWAKEAFGMK